MEMIGRVERKAGWNVQVADKNAAFCQLCAQPARDPPTKQICVGIALQRPMPNKQAGIFLQEEELRSGGWCGQQCQGGGSGAGGREKEESPGGAGAD